jgi:hypothetical protein
MSKKKMDPTEINPYIKANHKKLPLEQLAKDCGISLRAIEGRAYRMKLKLFSGDDMRVRLPAAKRYIITAAQNATPIHPAFWATLKRAAKYLEAELVVIPGRYKNPTSIWSKNSRENEWWDPAVVPYLCKGRISLNERIMILGDVKVQWAKAFPLRRLDALTKGMSGIVGHPNRALRSVATPQHKQPKIMFTTGACTKRNYTDSENGKMGGFDHCLGALIVEIDGDMFWARQLNADKFGGFIDLDKEFTPTDVHEAERALSLTPGDIHERWILPQVVQATFDAPDSIVKFLHPQYIVFNDLTDSHARNHHHKDDWITQVAKQKAGIESVREEIEDSVRFVNQKTPADCQAIVVISNHHEAIVRWLKETDFRKDPVNAIFYLETALAVAKSAERGTGGIEYDDPFILHAQKSANRNVRFLKQGESFTLKRVEYALHGHQGPNGVRGSTNNLSKLGEKVTKGHSHAAEIIGGCYSAGVCTGPLEYEGGGPSNHSNSHVIQYANGKRAIIFVINGRYCLDHPGPLPAVKK